MGFDKLEKGKNAFVHYREENGLPNNSVFSILEDDKGNLWMSANKGIAKFNKKTETFTNYDYRDGLQGNEFNGAAGLKLKNGELAFGGIKGLNVFNPNNITKSTLKPVTSITDVKLFNKQLSNRNYNWKITKQINLTYKENTLSFDFICLDFAIPQKNKYKYIMEGIDNEPILTTAKNRSVTYAGLPPGNYIFKVWGANSDGVWDNSGDFVNINITPPFWGTLWFRGSAVIFFIILSNLLFFAWKKLYISYSYWRNTHIIGKRYKISEKIGSGGTGAVYKAYDKITNKTVALKILDDKYLDEETAKRFSIEQSVYEKIKHINTVEIYKKGTHGGKLYYVMEYIDGVTLSQFVKMKNLSEKQILSIFTVLLDIINEIHSNGVIHRDLKPDNIMLTNHLQTLTIPENFQAKNELTVLKNNIKILDFGLAKILGSKTLTQSAIFGGTLYYFPPEFLFGKKVRETTFDFYSLGVVLYEMLTDSHLYNVENSAELLAAVVSGTPIPPKEKTETISKEVSDFVMQLIAKQPNDRLNNYKAIKNALFSLKLK
jgi:tRNA A-37 threonylcarbamoyl transferase component Bud32